MDARLTDSETCCKFENNEQEIYREPRVRVIYIKVDLSGL